MAVPDGTSYDANVYKVSPPPLRLLLEFGYTMTIGILKIKGQYFLENSVKIGNRF